MAGLAMKQEEVIRMARESGLEAYSILPHKEIDWDCLVDDLATFAALVAAAEREACAKVCEDTYTGEEACGDWPTPEMCARAIRARGDE